jgi:hypothetical protein
LGFRSRREHENETLRDEFQPGIRSCGPASKQ